MDLIRNISATLERIGFISRELQWKAAYAIGLNPTQARILRQCAKSDVAGGSYTQKELAGELGVSAASLCDSVGALRRKGLVTVRRLQGDARRSVIVLSTRGRSAARKLEKWDSELCRAISDEEQKRVEGAYEFLLILVRNLYRQGIITLPRMCFTCWWFQANPESEKGKYWCGLLETELGRSDLRFECPEHRA